MIKLEEDISLMEEQSVSDLDDTQQEDYTTSQVVRPFLGLSSRSANFLLSSVSGVWKFCWRSTLSPTERHPSGWPLWNDVDTNCNDPWHDHQPNGRWVFACVFLRCFWVCVLTKDGPEPYFYHINKPLTWHLEEGFNSQLHTQSMGNR